MLQYIIEIYGSKCLLQKNKLYNILRFVCFRRRERKTMVSVSNTFYVKSVKNCEKVE